MLSQGRKPILEQEEGCDREERSPACHVLENSFFFLREREKERTCAHDGGEGQRETERES